MKIIIDGPILKIYINYVGCWNSVFRDIGVIWVITVLITSVNTSARVQLESYPQIVALPLGIIAVGIGIYLASRFVKKPLTEMDPRFDQTYRRRC